MNATIPPDVPATVFGGDLIRLDPYQWQLRKSNGKVLKVASPGYSPTDLKNYVIEHPALDPDTRERIINFVKQCYEYPYKRYLGTARTQTIRR